MSTGKKCCKDNRVRFQICPGSMFNIASYILQEEVYSYWFFSWMIWYRYDGSIFCWGGGGGLSSFARGKSKSISRRNYLKFLSFFSFLSIPSSFFLFLSSILFPFFPFFSYSFFFSFPFPIIFPLSAAQFYRQYRDRWGGFAPHPI